MSTQEILRTVLSEMENEFTSMQFCKEARKHNLPERLIWRGGVAKYLHKNAIKLKGYTWQKRNEYNLFENKNNIKENNSKDLEYINYLKSKGYRIQKIEYKEI